MRLAPALFRAALLCSSLALAPSARASEELATLNEEFDAPILSSEWKLFHQEYGWANHVKALKVENGALWLEPYHSAWVRDRYAPFLFKTVEGDFDVRARVRVRSAAGEVPAGTWSLGGLIARLPNGSRAGSWEPRRENWNFITTGVGHVAGETMTETKGTYNSTSSLKLRPFERGWVELRLVRVGMTMFALARPDARSPWRVRDRWYRMDTPPWSRAAKTEVGLIAYTTSPDAPAREENPEVNNRTVNKDAKVDMILDVDWIRYARPKETAGTDWYAQVSAANTLADGNLSEAEVLRRLGD
jgi:hypothetical protein